MKMSKKGISPLIATVLILGFTVALAAIIMNWGTKFTKDIQTSTSESATANIACSQDVTFSVSGVCKDAISGTYKITVANDGKAELKLFKVRLYRDSTNALGGDSTGVPIPSFGIASINSPSPGTLTSIKKIDLTPVITINAKDVPCSANIESYGDLNGDGSDIEDACL